MGFSEDEIAEFKIEACELLDQGERSLLQLDAGSAFSVEYDAIFRSFHSIKGAAGMMDMHALQKHMHELENLLVEQRAKSTLAKPYVNHFLEGIDICRQMLQGHDVESKPFNAAQEEKMTETATSAAVAAPVRAGSLTPTPSPAAKPKIMIIDDERSIVDLLSEILKPRGFDVYGFSSPELAIASVASISPDVILTDIMMPVLSGLDVLSKVREMGLDLPVVFISAHADKNVLLQAIDKGIYAVLEKPFHLAAVLEICRNAVEKRRLLNLVNSSINLLIYQFSDLDDFLISQNKQDIRNVIDRGINELLDQRRQLRNIS